VLVYSDNDISRAKKSALKLLTSNRKLSYKWSSHSICAYRGFPYNMQISARRRATSQFPANHYSQPTLQQASCAARRPAAGTLCSTQRIRKRAYSLCWCYWFRQAL